MPRLRSVLALTAVLLCACDGATSSSANGQVAAIQGSPGAARGSMADTLRARRGAPDTLIALLRAAERAIDEGHPWAATRLLASAPGDAARRPPEVVLVSARAAAGWEGWTDVDRLLAGATWVDALGGGEGRELMAQSALAGDDREAAMRHAAAAVASADNGTQRARRAVLLARALDRADRTDSAAAVYAAAADGPSLEGVREWLLLRSAGARTSREERQRLYASVRRSPASTRVAWTEAQALERFGDPAAAADRYLAVGDTLDALRLRLLSAADAQARDRARVGLIAFMRARGASAESRQAVAVLDERYGELPIADDLEIARAMATAVPARAIRAFERARAATPLSASDELQYALALGRAGRTADAMATLARIREPARLAAQAAYQHARLTLSARGAAAAQPLLRQVAESFRTDTATAAAARYLLADLYTDDGDDVRARAEYRALASAYPTSAWADEARFHAAIIALARGEARVAALELDTLVARYPASGERLSARYWSGRAWERAGDARAARERWSGLLTLEPLSYYAIMAAKRLGRPSWAPPAAGVAFPENREVDGTVARVALLRALGMDAEARFELDALDSLATRSRDAALAVGRGLVRAGEAGRAIRLGLRLIQQDATDRRAFEIAFPVVGAEELVRAARAHGLDPALVAGLIRQESSFTPTAVSVAGARGLMQVMPPVGAEVARSLRFPSYSPGLLFDADANLQLGTAHLAASVRQYPDIARVLAAYNAGQSRVTRWSRKAGTQDAELFTERIPYVETRDYVRIVQRNAEVYRALHNLK